MLCTPHIKDRWGELECQLLKEKEFVDMHCHNNHFIRMDECIHMTLSLLEKICCNSEILQVSAQLFLY